MTRFKTILLAGIAALSLSHGSAQALMASEWDDPTPAPAAKVQAPQYEAPAWHRVARDSVAQAYHPIFAGGRIVAVSRPLIELHAGTPVLVGLGGIIQGDIHTVTEVQYGTTTLLIGSAALDPAIVHCEQHQVLAHIEITCSDDER